MRGSGVNERRNGQYPHAWRSVRVADCFTDRGIEQLEEYCRCKARRRTLLSSSGVVEVLQTYPDPFPVQCVRAGAYIYQGATMPRQTKRLLGV